MKITIEIEADAEHAASLIKALAETFGTIRQPREEKEAPETECDIMVFRDLGDVYITGDKLKGKKVFVNGVRVKRSHQGRVTNDAAIEVLTKLLGKENAICLKPVKETASRIYLAKA